MTKWARMRRRKERRRAEELPKNSTTEGNETKLAEPKKITDNVKDQHTQKLESSKDSKSNSILSQIPRYVYLVAIFALLSGVFFPLITIGAEDAFSFVVGGTATLFLGLAGGVLVYKAVTSVTRQGIFLAIGFTLIAISLALIFLIQEWWKMEFIRS